MGIKKQLQADARGYPFVYLRGIRCSDGSFHCNYVILVNDQAESPPSFTNLDNINELSWNPIWTGTAPSKLTKIPYTKLSWQYSLNVRSEDQQRAIPFHRREETYLSLGRHRAPIEAGSGGISTPRHGENKPYVDSDRAQLSSEAPERIDRGAFHEDLRKTGRCEKALERKPGYLDDKTDCCFGAWHEVLKEKTCPGSMLRSRSRLKAQLTHSRAFAKVEFLKDVN